MSWTPLDFGEYEGKSIPEVIFKDIDWFFWAYEKKLFKGALGKEAINIYEKSRNIRIPSDGREKLVAEYRFHPSNGKFVDLEIIPESRPVHLGSNGAKRIDVIDLYIPRNTAIYDKLGCKLLIDSVKSIIFGSTSVRMTKKRCEEFFENDDNFILKS